ncbi:hypothetical protein PV08_11998 [Exophiala spinifera]|uniref:Uncharacterized protein n=1 Tax=Exophiala spinifera TaxID=91928 RepID=A0A0D1ZA53_9EURO|nr:uncharacterized protein PV08_11998 [Exophiala spinifera]KIW09897.1 hypothetical protein PV08_11998 [Exophiala spinifera]
MLQQIFSLSRERRENRLRADDEDEILAWIDYCIAKRLGPVAFEKSIVAHLSHSRQRDFTFQQIDARVKNWWKAPTNLSRPNGETYSGYTIVYRIGTKALRGGAFNDERAQSVKARVQQLMKQPVPEYARPSSQSARQKRKAEHTSIGDIVAKRLFKQTKRSHPNSRADSVDVPGKSPRNSISVQIPATPSKPAEDAHGRRNSRAHSTVPKREHSRTLSSPTASLLSDFIDDSQSPSASWCIADSEVFLTPPRDVVQPISTRISPSPLITSVENSSSCSLSECGRVRQLLSDRGRDLQHLRGKLSDAYRTIDELKTQLASEEHRRAICKNAGEAPTQETLRGYLAEIEILRSQLFDKEVFRPFTTRNISKHMPFDREYFHDSMVDIRNEIDDFMCRCGEIQRPCNDINFEEAPDDLKALLHRVLGDSGGTLQAISFHSLLRSILSAAVCEWVLECDVREPMITGCLMCDTMLSHLTTMDGEDVARNLDLAVHHSLIESEDFQQEVIPRRAEALAMRLSERVKPLFGLQNPLDLWEVDILEEWQQQRPQLKKIFISALKVKTKALVSKDIFEVIFPLPGCKYDPKHMESERLEQDNGSSELGQSPIVRLCLVPGLRKFAFDKKHVDYNSFRRPSPSFAEPGDGIVGPLVIVE